MVGLQSLNKIIEIISIATAALGHKEPVIFLKIGDDARAYPLQILTWHEIVNDVV